MSEVLTKSEESGLLFYNRCFILLSLLESTQPPPSRSLTPEMVQITEDDTICFFQHLALQVQRKPLLTQSGILVLEPKSYDFLLGKSHYCLKNMMDHYKSTLMMQNIFLSQPLMTFLTPYPWIMSFLLLDFPPSFHKSIS